MDYWQLDFSGDRFTVIYETFHDQGELTPTGRVLAAEFVNNYKVFQAVWFQHGETEGGYYTLEGKNFRKAFHRFDAKRIAQAFASNCSGHNGPNSVIEPI